MFDLVLIELFITYGKGLVKFFDLLAFVPELIHKPIDNILALVILLTELFDFYRLNLVHLLVL